MDREESRDTLPPNELLRRAQTYNHRDSLPPDEYEALMHLGESLLPPANCEAQCFILGSYDTGEKQKLLYLQREIEERLGDHRAYLMDDLPDGLHPMIEFKLIADYSDYIIGVCEHDQGGFQLELGMLIAMMDYFEQSYLLKRTYQPSKEREKYNWMLDAGVFEMFDYADRLYEWEDGEEFKIAASDLFFDLL